jgi:hypothetical protein
VRRIAESGKSDLTFDWTNRYNAESKGFP